MANNELQVILDSKHVDKENAQQLIKAFGAPFTEAGKIISNHKKLVVTDESQTDLMKQARSQRLELRKIRVGVENKRKELKADYLTVTQAIDGVARYIKQEIEPVEEYLELQERYAEIKQAERHAKLKQERTEKLMAYTDTVSVYNLDEMTADEFKAVLATLKAQFEAKQKQAADELAAAEKAEKERIAEDKRVREENERLRKEAAAREAAAAKEREAEAKRQAAIDAELEKERAAAQAAINAEREKREEMERQQRERDAAAAKEKADREAAEAKAKADADAKALEELLAPDKQKLITFSNAIETIRVEKLPAVKSKQAQDVVNLIDEMLQKMNAVIKTKCKEL